MIIGLQVVSIVFSLMMLYFAYLHYQRGEINGMEIFSWFLIWTVTIGIVIFPQVLQAFAQTFAISRVFDLMVVGGFILVITIAYKAYIKTRRLERKMEEFVRAEALKKKTRVR